MNREIKFRALTKNNNVMVFGDLIFTPTKEHRIIWFELKGEMPLDVDYQYFDEIVQSSTIGQFTGFTIKGNDELYENDLIENDGEMFRIEFLDGSWECINIVNGENIALSELASSRDTCLQGNIYQHPELNK